LKKQSQFHEGQNGRNYFFYKSLWGFLWMGAAKKQSQFKVNKSLIAIFPDATKMDT